MLQSIVSILDKKFRLTVCIFKLPATKKSTDAEKSTAYKDKSTPYKD